MSTLRGNKKISIERTVLHPTVDRQRRCTTYTVFLKKTALQNQIHNPTSLRWGKICAENIFLAQEGDTLFFAELLYFT